MAVLKVCMITIAVNSGIVHINLAKTKHLVMIILSVVLQAKNDTTLWKEHFAYFYNSSTDNKILTNRHILKRK